MALLATFCERSETHKHKCFKNILITMLMGAGAAGNPIWLCPTKAPTLTGAAGALPGQQAGLEMLLVVKTIFKNSSLTFA